MLKSCSLIIKGMVSLLYFDKYLEPRRHQSFISGVMSSSPSCHQHFLPQEIEFNNQSKFGLISKLQSHSSKPLMQWIRRINYLANLDEVKLCWKMCPVYVENGDVMHRNIEYPVVSHLIIMKQFMWQVLFTERTCICKLLSKYYFSYANNNGFVDTKMLFIALLL